jgi:mRNA interferase MazF
MIFNPGEILIAKFPFTSLESTKRRPCLVLANGDIKEDLIVAFITSTKVQEHFKYTVKISPLEKDFILTGLKVESFIRLDKLATLHISIISGGIGKISPQIKDEVDNKLKLLFNL